MIIIRRQALAAAMFMACGATAVWAQNTDPPPQKPIKVFVLAGDEYVLEHAPVQAKDGPKPGTLKSVVAEHADKYAYLKDDTGRWASREDVLLYDAHPIHNSTKAPAEPIRVGVEGRSGPERTPSIGVTLSLSHRLGEAIEQPVLIVRFGTEHPIWFRRGSRDLSHDFRPPSSGGGSDLDGSWDVIHFNHGIHDTAYRNPRDYKDKDQTQFPICVPLDRYEANLRHIVARLKKTGATLIWARITPVKEGTPGWRAADIDKYNAVADKVMKENNVIINDLHAEAIRQGAPSRPNVHSVGNLAPKVTKVILQAIDQRQNKTKPLPRVLFIGDSITGTYWSKVQQNLDGKAVVFKNPANAGTSEFGRAELDNWIDLKTYLLNGQEYLQLIAGVRDAMKNPERVIANYDGRPLELAGLIWFQGEDDGNWDSKAAAYHEHLPNLIRDLRKDLGAADLPVVVVALANAKQKLNPRQQKVFDAQMAVGNPEKFSEFAGNVVSIDTRPMCRPPNQSPGGRDRYAGNAQTYLEIGEATAQAMLKLIGKP